MPKKISVDNASHRFPSLDSFARVSGVYCFHYDPMEVSRKYCSERKGEEIENADQADSNSEIKGLSNLIMQTDTNTHEREPAGSQKQLIIIHMKYLENV